MNDEKKLSGTVSKTILNAINVVLERWQTACRAEDLLEESRKQLATAKAYLSDLAKQSELEFLCGDLHVTVGEDGSVQVQRLPTVSATEEIAYSCDLPLMPVDSQLDW